MMRSVVSIVAAGILAAALAAPAAQAQQRMARPGMQARAGYQQRNMHGAVPGVNLSAAQRERIAAIRSDARRQASAVQNNRRLSAAEKERRTARIWSDAHNRVMSVMNAQQRQAFHSARSRERVAGYRGEAQRGPRPMRRGQPTPRPMHRNPSAR